MSRARVQSGFTLVELTIAVAFLAILLMAILSLTLAAGKLYVKGDTNKTINQAARDFGDVVRRDFLAAGVGLVSPEILLDVGTPTEPLASGRICLGTVTYLWNTAGVLNSEEAIASTVRVAMESTGDPIKFVRIVRPQQTYCDKNPVTDRYPMTIPASETATEMFTGTGRDYALHAMRITPVSEQGDRALYRVAYTLGTNEAGTTEMDEGGFIRCKTNNDVAANFDYCSVSDFDMMVRIGGTQE